MYNAYVPLHIADCTVIDLIIYVLVEPKRSKQKQIDYKFIVWFTWFCVCSLTWKAKTEIQQFTKQTHLSKARSTLIVMSERFTCFGHSANDLSIHTWCIKFTFYHAGTEADLLQLFSITARDQDNWIAVQYLFWKKFIRFVEICNVQFHHIKTSKLKAGHTPSGRSGRKDWFLLCCITI